MADFCLRIDDSDPRIDYVGSWQILTNTSNPEDFPASVFSMPGELPKPIFYNDTLHGTNSTFTLSFSYQGLPNAVIFGDMTNRTPYTCFIEDSKGNNVFGGYYTFSQESQDKVFPVTMPLCALTTFPGDDLAVPNNYVLKFSTTNITTIDFQILIDYIVYQPFANVSLGNQDVIQVGNCLPLTRYQGLQAGLGWGSGGGSISQIGDSLQSSLSGSSMTFKFNGTSVGVEAMNNGSLGLGHYSIDGNDPVTLDLFNSTDFQLLLLESSLSPAEHILTVQIDNDAAGSLLVNDFFFTSFASEEQNSSSPSTQTAPDERHNHNKAVIAGVTAGVAALLLIFIIVILILRRRRNSRGLPPSAEFLPTPFVRRNSWPLNSSEMIYLGSKRRPLADSLPSLATGADLAQTRLATLKLQQRLEVTQGQLQREQEVARNQRGLSNTPPGTTMPVHVDSGLRLGPQGEVRDNALQGVPPEYTEE
ncbi:hypothetical protein GYMLUDRAFT_58970 [Collybiopsis luxurians FD-317 M1]|uniref:Carbohydrate esterase 2 N-terminal domain-containing protein n=1 Tax=Collybiopsis luxurians FD-317 M1 TaxID=944289 RepID=A0A0D0CYQ2_9AGAR|nr:hypothetical protein GYMLUDRAFT_58970 [Collybiopsis luxurians FD-317 M1]